MNTVAIAPIAPTAAVSAAFPPGYIPRPGPGWLARARGTAIGRAAIGSIVVHVLLIAFVPGFRSMLPQLPLPERIDVVLKPRPQLAPAPVEAPKPQVQPLARPSPQPQLQQRRNEARETPLPRMPERQIMTAAPESTTAAPAIAQPVQSIEPAPVPDVFKPAPVAVEPPKPVAPAVAEGPSDSLIAAFGTGFKASVDKNRRYPRQAQDRGWQGTATVLVKVLPGGRLGDVTIAASSGHSLLDDTAREMVKGAPLPPLPEGLRSHGFELRIPVEFRLV
ncbi:MAG TPA: TonB family protein [Rhodocyclaceae bacterium]|nr:TonB family protein [Rhodocyclaceae bacterium]HNB77851.1 TonB family protein [Rhodocyclaceae bacterium]